LSAGTPSRNASACGAHEAGGSASQIRQIGVEASDQRTTRPRRGPAEDSARRDRTRGQEGARARRRQGGQQARRREGPGASQKGQHRPDAANQDRETGDETRGTRRERGQARGPGIQNISPYCGTFSRYALEITAFPLVILSASSDAFPWPRSASPHSRARGTLTVPGASRGFLN
jgi:hypothetical protein